MKLQVPDPDTCFKEDLQSCLPAEMQSRESSAIHHWLQMCPCCCPWHGNCPTLSSALPRPELSLLRMAAGLGTPTCSCSSANDDSSCASYPGVNELRSNRTDVELGAITHNCKAHRHSEASEAVSGRALGCVKALQQRFSGKDA